MIIGGQTRQSINGILAKFQVLGTTAVDSRIAIGRWEADTTSPGIDFYKSRNVAIGSNTAVTTGDTLGQITALGDDGTDDDTLSSSIIFDSEGTISTGQVPGFIDLQTAAAGTLASVLKLDSSKLATFGGNIIIPNSGIIGIVGDTDLITLTANTVTIAGQMASTSIDAGDGVISSVGDIELDSISNENGTLAITIETDGDAFFAGKVGIGITPTRDLDIFTASGAINSQIASASLASGEEVQWYSTGTGNSIARQSSIGTVYYDQSGQAGTNAPVGFIFLESGDGANNFLWTDDTDDLRISATNTHRGAGNLGTVVGDQTSDERLKDKIQPLRYGLAELMQLDPIEFDRNGVHVLGFGAQRTQPILPEVVYNTKDYVDPATQSEPNKLAMKQIQILAVAVKAIQQLTERLETLEAK